MANALPAAEEKALADKFAFGLEGTPAAQSVSDLTEADFLAADLAYHYKKQNGSLDRERDRVALEMDVAAMRRRGFL